VTLSSFARRPSRDVVVLKILRFHPPRRLADEQGEENVAARSLCGSLG